MTLLLDGDAVHLEPTTPAQSFKHLYKNSSRSISITNAKKKKDMLPESEFLS